MKWMQMIVLKHDHENNAYAYNQINNIVSFMDEMKVMLMHNVTYDNENDTQS